MAPLRAPNHAGGAKTLSDELQQLADQAALDDDDRGRRIAELAARLGLAAYHLHVRLDRLQGRERSLRAFTLALLGVWVVSLCTAAAITALHVWGHGG